ncbi:MAG: hypothetical protein GC161_13410 [Planctomycetaceae bacterium]|nr:hypothetical protein [Planctomycetaceae bacterium]
MRAARRRPPPLFAALALVIGALPLAPASRAQTAPQPVPGPAVPPRPAGFQLFDGVAATVDDRAVTFAAIDETLLAQLGRIDRSDQAALQRASAQIVQNFVVRRVQAQGGAEMGLADEDVRRVVRSILEDQRRPFGALEYAERLRERGSDPLREDREMVSEMYESVWMETVTGRSGGAGRRPSVDRYLRPSRLAAAYVQSRDVLGSPPDVEFAVLDLLSAAAGGPEAARSLAEELRGEALAGKDFAELVREYGYTARERGGALAPVRADQIADPELAGFALKAKPGDLSPVRPLFGERGDLMGYRVAKLLGRSGGTPAPPFTEAATQRTLRDQLLERSDRLTIDQAGQRLMNTSHIWVHPVWGPAPPRTRS